MRSFRDLDLRRNIQALMAGADVGRGLSPPAACPKDRAVWDQPYLETCCRAALHRLFLCGRAGRPAGLADDPCLKRLSDMDLCRRRGDGRYEITLTGARRHATEVLLSPAKDACFRPD